MRHVTKILLGLAAFLVMAGGLLAVGGWAMGAETNLHFDWHGREFYIGHGGALISGTEAAPLPGGGEKGGARNLETLTDIDIDVALADVEFRHADDYGVSLEWHYGQTEMEYEVHDGRLTVWMPRRGGGLNVGGGFRIGRVIVYLPEDAQLDQVYLSNSMGGISMSGCTMEELTVENSMGGVTLSGLKVEELSVENSMGEVTATSCNVSDFIYVSNSMSDITLTGNLRGDITLENSMGAIELRTDVERRAFGYDLSTSMATVTVDGEDFDEDASKGGGDYHISASNSMGDIDIFFGR